MPDPNGAGESGDTRYGQFPLRDHLGLDVSTTGPGTARASLTADDRHLNPNGVVHGAVLFSMVDTAMGAAAMSVVPEGSACASVEVHLRFLRPAMAGALSTDVVVDRRQCASCTCPGAFTPPMGDWWPRRRQPLPSSPCRREPVAQLPRRRSMNERRSPAGAAALAGLSLQ